MGWFDWFEDETIYSAGVSITHLVQELPENPLKAAVLSAIRNDGSIVSNIVAAREKTMFVRAEDYYLAAVGSPQISQTSHDFPEQLGAVIPILSIRENTNNILNSGDTAKIAATNKVLSTLGLTLEKLTEALNSSPGTVDDVYTMYAFNVWSETVGSDEYFFRFLEKLYDADWDQKWWPGIQYSTGFGGTYWNGDFTVLNGGSGPWKNYHISQAGNELDSTIHYLTIKKETITGTVGAIGSFTKEMHVYDNGGSTYLRNELYLYKAVNATSSLYHNFDSISLTKQVSETQYEKYTIYGFRVDNEINTPTGTKTVTHTVKGLSQAAIDHPENITDGSKATFVIPLFKPILEDMNLFSQEQFLADSLILYVHTVDATTVAWYQSQGFMDLVSIVINIVSVAFAGSYIIQSSELVFMLKQVAITLLTNVASEYLYEALASIVGDEAAAAILGIAVIAAVSYANADGKGLGELPWAEDLLKSALVIIEAAEKVIENESLQLIEDITEFTALAEEGNKELEIATSLLGKADVNLLGNALDAIIGFSETPEEFYNRTIHQGNIGILSIEAVNKYVNKKLELPKEFTPTYN